MGKIASIDRGWLQTSACSQDRVDWPVGKIASIDRGWLLKAVVAVMPVVAAWEK